MSERDENDEDDDEGWVWLVWSAPATAAMVEGGRRHQAYTAPLAHTTAGEVGMGAVAISFIHVCC